MSKQRWANPMCGSQKTKEENKKAPTLIISIAGDGEDQGRGSGT